MNDTMQRIVAWLESCFMAAVEVAGDDPSRGTGLLEDLDAASDQILAAQEVAHRALQRYHDLKPELEEVLNEVWRRQGKPPKGQREPSGEPGESFQIEMLSAAAGPCGICRREVGAGPVGWRTGSQAGALCNRCLARRSPDLGAVLAAVNYVRQISRPPLPGTEELEERGRPIVAMARRFAAATAGRWPVRATDSLDGMIERKRRMEERHGMFWLEVKRQRGEEPEPS